MIFASFDVVAAALSGRAFGTEVMDLVKRTAPIMKSARNARQITDWPFEHFWSDPNEPRHSKLIAYFIDPARPWGNQLLRGLLRDCFKNDVRSLYSTFWPFEDNAGHDAARAASHSESSGVAPARSNTKHVQPPVELVPIRFHDACVAQPSDL